MKKKSYGQFYTTEYKYIFQNMKIPSNISTIIEPFAGNCDLLKFIDNIDKYQIELYDIDPTSQSIIKRDTLNDIPEYNNKFVLTNPPYLARNKNKDKTLYDKYKCNDLYKCFILSLINSGCIGGIIIVPLNFICSIRKNDIKIREQFLNAFNITSLNIFEERVFNDTSYTVCSILFKKKTNDYVLINCYIYPLKKNIKLKLIKSNNYTIGGEIYNLPKSKIYKITRATKNTDNTCITNIVLKCIDNNIHNKICLKFVNDEDIFIDNTEKLSARSYATLIIKPEIDFDKQKVLVKKFNDFLGENREKYNSLFLTNYRESNSIARKRISFKLAFDICSYLLISI